MRAKGAVLSPCCKYRYVLWRDIEMPPELAGKGTVLWVMLNPSTADARKNDQTIGKVEGFTQRWGYNRAEVVNLYSYRATDPKKLLKCEDPIGPDADFWIGLCARRADLIVLAWGATNLSLPKRVIPSMSRITEVLATLNHSGMVFHCLGKTAKGQPRHPGRSIPYSTELEVY